MTTATDLDELSRTPASALSLAVQTTIVFALALAIRLFGLGEAPVHFDEYYHLFAADGWLRTGTLEILGGEYHRTALYTTLVAYSQMLFGETLWAARLPAAIAGAGVAAVVFAWVGGRRSEPATGSAWLAALAVVLAPELVELSQMTRFYGLHSLMVMLAAVGVFRLVTGWPDMSPVARTTVATGTAACLALGLYLQQTTAIAMVGMAAGAAVVIVVQARWRLPARGRDRLALAGLLLVGLLGLAGLHLTGALHAAWAEFRSVALWNAQNKDHLSYYHWHFKDTYGPLWYLFPGAVLLAVGRAPRLTLFCTGLFATALVLHSLAGMKNGRYIAYALPFFLVVWAVALPVAGGWLMARTRLALDRGLGLPEARIGALPHAALALGGVAAVLGAMLMDAAKPWRDLEAADGAWLATSYRLRMAEAESGWTAAAALTRDRLAQDAVVITADEFRTLHHLGRVDLVVSRSRLAEGPSMQDFTRDRRTGLPVIGSAPALATVLRCAPSGIAVMDRQHFPSAFTFTPEMVATLTAGATRLTPPDAGVHVFAWNGGAAVGAGGPDCTDLALGPAAVDGGEGVGPTSLPALAAAPGVTGGLATASVDGPAMDGPGSDGNGALHAPAGGPD